MLDRGEPLRVARELLVKRLAVEQAGECVALAVVKQALVVLVDLKDALEHVELVRRKRPRLRDLQAGGDLVVHPHRQPQHVAPVARLGQRAFALAEHAFVQGRVGIKTLAPRVGGRFGVGGDELAVVDPRAGAHMVHTPVREQFQRPHLDDATELLQGGEHRHLQPHVVAVAGHLYQVLQNGLHWGCTLGHSRQIVNGVG